MIWPREQWPRAAALFGPAVVIRENGPDFFGPGVAIGLRIDGSDFFRSLIVIWGLAGYSNGERILWIGSGATFEEAMASASTVIARARKAGEVLRALLEKHDRPEPAGVTEEEERSVFALWIICPECKGSAVSDSSGPNCSDPSCLGGPCATCEGRGRIRRPHPGVV